MMGNVDDHYTRQPSHRKKLTGITQSALGYDVSLAFGIPGSGENNRGTSRLSPMFPPCFPRGKPDCGLLNECCLITTVIFLHWNGLVQNEVGAKTPILTNSMSTDPYFQRTGIDLRRVLTIAFRILAGLMFCSGAFGLLQYRRDLQTAAWP